MADFSLHQIQAPGLTSTQYGKDIRDQFQNIDDNFRRVSNRDYVAGQTGSSVYFKDLDLWDGTSFTDLGKIMLDTLTGVSGIDWNNVDWSDPRLTSYVPIDIPEGTSVRTVYFYDYIKDNSSLTVLYTIKDIEADPIGDNLTYVCSPQVYTFMDKRFANVSEGGGIGLSETVQQVTFEGLSDTSCLLTCEFTGEHTIGNAQFKKCNIFPTLYFDKDENTFKWAIYGEDTGIRAQGAQGTAGARAAVWVVSSIPVEPNNRDVAVSQSPNPDVTHKIVQISSIVNNEVVWTNIDDAPIKPAEGDVCICLTPCINTDGEEPVVEYVSNAFVSPVVVEVSGSQTTYLVYSNQQNSIVQNMRLNNLKMLLLSLGNTDSADLLGGLFLPYKDGSNVSDGAHFIYHKYRSIDNINTLNVRPISPVTEEIMRSPSNGTTDVNTELLIDYGKITLNSTDKDIVLYSENDIDSTAVGNADITTYKNMSLQAQESVTVKSNTEHTTFEAPNESYAVHARVNGINDVYLGCPIGTIVMWAGDEDHVPEGWLLCRGQEVPRSTYSKLWSVIRVTYGRGNGYSTFNVPDLQQKFPLGVKETGTIGKNNDLPLGLGWSTKLGDEGGEPTHTLTANEIKHEHILKDNGLGVTENPAYGPDTNTDKQISMHNSSHNNIPPFLALNFIIKAL